MSEHVIRVVLPAHLRTLARLEGEVVIEDYAVTSLRDVLDTLEQRCPALTGTMRDPVTARRRPFVRFYACREDISHDSPDEQLPRAILQGHEPLLGIGAMAGG